MQLLATMQIHGARVGVGGDERSVKSVTLRNSFITGVSKNGISLRLYRKQVPMGNETVALMEWCPLSRGCIDLEIGGCDLSSGKL